MRTNSDNGFTPTRIRALRKAMCLDRANFAIAIGASRASVWRWEVLGDRPNNLACNAMLLEEQKLQQCEVKR